MNRNKISSKFWHEFKECERSDSPNTDLISRCRAGLAEFELSLAGLEPEKFAAELCTESDFKGGEVLIVLRVQTMEDTLKTFKNPPRFMNVGILLKLMIRFENPTYTVAWQCREPGHKKSAETENLCRSTRDGERMRLVCKGKMSGRSIKQSSWNLPNGHYSLYWKSTMWNIKTK